MSLHGVPACREPVSPVPTRFRAAQLKTVRLHLKVVQVKLTHYLVGNASAPRRGPKGYFDGSRIVFLESRLPAYRAARKGNRQTFWHKLFSAWWQQYPWRLADSREPPTNDLEKMAGLASAGPDDSAQKGVIERRLEEVRSFHFLRADRDLSSCILASKNLVLEPRFSGNRRNSLRRPPLATTPPATPSHPQRSSSSVHSRP